MTKTRINTDDVILQYQDNEGVIHEISLNNLLEGGIPINEDDESDMELLDTYVLG